MLFRGFEHVSEGVFELLVVAVEHRLFAHRVGQIVRADEGDVESRDAENLLGSLDRLDVLDHRDDENLVVGAGVIGCGIGVEVRRMQLSADGAFAERLIARGANRGFGFGA